ncbi:hypothetical protein BJQ90_02131 [Arthrobacter sp. SO3]|nr:hypothetical protein [Arthrobacter sp. SO3]
MGDVNGGGPEVLDDLLQFGPERQTEQGIQVGERLVHKKHVGVHHDGPGHGDALALTAGELGRKPVKVRGELKQIGSPLDFALNFLGIDLGHLQPEADVVPDLAVREHGVGLENHGHVALVRRQVGDVAAADRDRAGVRELEASHHPQQRGFAAAGGAEQHGEVAVLDVQGDIVGGAVRAAGVGLDEVGDGDISHDWLLLG